MTGILAIAATWTTLVVTRAVIEHFAAKRAEANSRLGQ